MRTSVATVVVAAACLAACLAATRPVRAEEPAPAPPPGPHWTDAAEVGIVVTSGNTETSTFGLKNSLARENGPSRFELKAGGIRVETTTITLFAVGTPGDFEREKLKDSETTAESYYLNGRYDRKISEHFFWFTGAGWDRNLFAGVQNRYVVSGGVGNIWSDSDRRKWRTDYSVTGTREEDVAEPPGFDGTFAGVRVASSFLQKFGSASQTSYTNDTIVDDSVDHSTDWRVNMTNSLAVNMTTHLALKVSLQWLYDHQPAVKQVDLFAPGTAPPADTPIGRAFVDVDDLDTIFTTALVIKY